MTGNPAPTMVDLINDMVRQTVPSLTALGIEVIEAVEGRASTRLPFAQNSNHFGAMYAGAMFCAGEVLGAAVLAPSFDFAKAYPLVKDLKISYRRPARSDVVATAEVDAETLAQIAADLEANGKANWQMEATLTDTAGEVVATMVGDYQLRAIA